MQHRGTKGLLLASALLFTSSAARADDDDDGEHGKGNERSSYAIGLWGDLPYSAAQEAALPKLIEDMNAQKLAFTVNDGDLKAGSNSACDNALYARALGWFGMLKAPAAFTPGDNDWTDCDRANNGGYNSLERLDYERSVFFSTRESLGQSKLTQEVQTA
ncbi:MAG TPA: hypothetical protein VI299_25650, partial [Polyangiales bacterium]